MYQEIKIGEGRNGSLTEIRTGATKLSIGGFDNIVRVQMQNAGGFTDLQIALPEGHSERIQSLLDELNIELTKLFEPESIG